MPYPTYMLDFLDMIEDPECLLCLSAPTSDTQAPQENHSVDSRMPDLRSVDYTIPNSCLLSRSTLDAMLELNDAAETVAIPNSTSRELHSQLEVGEAENQPPVSRVGSSLQIVVQHALGSNERPTPSWNKANAQSHGSSTPHTNPVLSQPEVDTATNQHSISLVDPSLLLVVSEDSLTGTLESSERPTPPLNANPSSHCSTTPNTNTIRSFASPNTKLVFIDTNSPAVETSATPNPIPVSNITLLGEEMSLKAAEAVRDATPCIPPHLRVLAPLTSSTTETVNNTTTRLPPHLRTAARLAAEAAEADGESTVEAQNHASLVTALATRTTEDVIAELKRSQPSASQDTDDDLYNQDSFEEKNADQIAPATKIRKITEKKRRLNATVDNYVLDRSLKLIKTGKIVNQEDEANQSTRWLVNQSENREIISTPREYQNELFERAKERNIIAVLDTGSGKTLIAVLLLRHIFAQELEDRAIGKPKRISFFLVDSVTLVFQQHAVLKANLDQPMDMFCGDMGCDLWSRSQWEKHFSNNMVIVCTAEVLRQCLHHSFLSIEQINLLIFDEAHHAKKDHAYARIIKDFYAQAPVGVDLPKIFGMTASPVDARVDVAKAARELEAILHSQICTTSSPDLMKYRITASQEFVDRYAPLGSRVETYLYSKMFERFGKNPIMRKPLLYAYEATRELGTWCADQVWPFCLSEEETKKLQAKTERSYHATKFHEPLAVLEKRKAQLEEAREIVESYSFDPPIFNSALSSQDSIYTSVNLSSKVVSLVRHLKQRFERPTDDKCIIFVKQRYTARLLAKLLSHPVTGTPNLFVGTLVGTRTGDAGDLNVSFREQVITMLNFRKGILNCLVATSVAEEGLDIPDCNLIIRFDLYTTLIQYIQSRGRARHANSRYVHMVERDNQEHTNTVLEVQRNERLLKQFCQLAPADRKLHGNDYNMDHFLAHEKTHEVYIVPSTGAKLTYKMSLVVLSNFVDSLPQSVEGKLQAEYVMIAKGKQFECEVILPEASPVSGAVGRAHSTKQVAKCAAAFQACYELLQRNYLDENLLPIFTKKLPAMRNAVLAVSSKTSAAYDMKTKPKIWSVVGDPEQLFLTVLTLDHPGSLDRPSQPIAILTRSTLPQIPTFVLHFGGDKHSPVRCLRFELPVLISSETLSRINTFTLCLFNDIFSKEYEPDTSKMPYFIVPIRPDAAFTGFPDPASLIDWEILKSVEAYQAKWASKPWENDSWKTEPDDFFGDKYIIDPYDGSRKLFIVGRALQYKPLDPLPESVAPRPGARKNNDNIMEYSCSLWAKSRQSRTFDPDQRVYEARLVSLRRNLLDEFDSTADEGSSKCFVILETLQISCLPAPVVAMAYLFPAIIHRVESYLIALEATELLHLNISTDLALEACTKDSDNSGDHDSEKINFQRGMGNNYERLEFLGDCFLKMATTISLYGLHPGSDEYEYHVDRMLLICNKNLCNNAIKLKLFEYIRSQSFSRRAWYPEGLLLKKGKRVPAPNTHKLADKSIADVCEAMIGAALLTHHESNDMDNAVRAVTELVCSENHQATAWSDYYKQYEKPRYQTMVATEMQKNLAMQIEKKHAYHFRYPRVLRSAFIHPSYPFLYEKIPSYQRLEFLGDALLDMACVNFLFHQFPGKDPQWLTEHKMAMVSNQFLGALCVSLEFHRHLLALNGRFQKQIQDYVEEIQEARRQAELDAVRAGKLASECAPDYWTAVRQPPKCLPDIVEAYVGAVFVDSEYNYREVERFFDTHIKWFFADMSVYDTFANKHPTTFLTRFLQTNMGCNDWTVQTREVKSIERGKPMVVAVVIVHDQVISDFQAESSRYAKVGAAKKALEILEGFPLTEFRTTYRCECNDGSEDGHDEDVKQMIEGMHGTAA